MRTLETPGPEGLDAIDRKILRELQDDGRMTNVELARRAGISAPPCLRRVRRLEGIRIGDPVTHKRISRPGYTENLSARGITNR